MSGRDEDTEALAALLNDAQENQRKKEEDHRRGRGGDRNHRNGADRRDTIHNNNGNGRSYGEGSRRDRDQRHDDGRYDYYNGGGGDRERNRNRREGGEEQQGAIKRRRRWEEAEPPPLQPSEMEEDKPKELPSFGLSGALAKDEQTGNIYKGVQLKFSEPANARTPKTHWRLYVFKPNCQEPIEILHISKQSAYLLGRDDRVADIPVLHGSLSSQHCVLQYRAVLDQISQKNIVKPYLMDLGSTNGTFINGQRLEEARYYELRRQDVITLGASTREYVLLSEKQSAAINNNTK